MEAYTQMKSKLCFAAACRPAKHEAAQTPSRVTPMPIDRRYLCCAGHLCQIMAMHAMVGARSNAAPPIRHGTLFCR